MFSLDSLPKPIKQNLEINTKLVKSCQEYEKVECFPGDIRLSCVECQNGKIYIPVSFCLFFSHKKTFKEFNPAWIPGLTVKYKMFIDGFDDSKSAISYKIYIISKSSWVNCVNFLEL